MTTTACCFLILITVVASQTSQCVWNAINEWDHLNGDYIYDGEWNTGNGNYPYWKRNSPLCPDSAQYLFAAYHEKDKLHYWSIYPHLQPSTIDYPDCGNEHPSFPSDPSQCQKGWTVWSNDKDFVTISLTVQNEPCPSLPCGHIQVTGSQISNCDHTFTKDDTKNNVYTYNDIHQSTTTYLYFNQYTFKWYCSNTLDNDYCGDDTISDAYVTSNIDEWIDVAIGEQFQLNLSNNHVAIFQCLDTGPIPTEMPTIQPTQPPITTTDTTNATITTVFPSIYQSIAVTDVSESYLVDIISITATLTDNTVNTDSITDIQTTSVKEDKSIAFKQVWNGLWIAFISGVLFLCICSLMIWYRDHKKKIKKKLKMALEKVVSSSPSDVPSIANAINDSVSVNNTNMLSVNGEQKESDETLVMEWLQHVVGCPQYLNIFIQSGYETMEIIETIEDKAQLAEIGITKKGHQALIMEEIDSLREQRAPPTENVASDDSKEHDTEEQHSDTDEEHSDTEEQHSEVQIVIQHKQRMSIVLSEDSSSNESLFDVVEDNDNATPAPPETRDIADV